MITRAFFVDGGRLHAVVRLGMPKLLYPVFSFGPVRSPGGRARRHGCRHQVPRPALLQGHLSRRGLVRRVNRVSGVVICS